MFNKVETLDKSPTLVNGRLPDADKVNGVEQELEMRAHESGINAAFALKVALINQELAHIGMGRYQIMLFFTAGMGWFVDNLFLQGIAIILPSIQQEFDPAHVAHSTLALFCGLCVGAAFWGCSADIVGRRVAFNITLFISGAFGIIAGASTSFPMWCGFVACIGFGLGGNLPVDGALYLEVLPARYQWTLTLLSAFWAIGQVVGSVIVWPMVINFSCPLAAEPSLSTGNDICQAGTFARSGGSNQGWRYSMYIFGGMTIIMWMIRFFAFPIQESPKWLAAKNRDVACIAALQKIAKTNRTTCTLTVEDLQHASMKVGVDPADAGMSIMQTLKNSMGKLSLSNITPLFSTNRLAINTTLIVLIWGLIGLAYPLFNAFLGLYLTGLPGQTKNSAYSNYAIQAACGVPGSIIAAMLVEWRVKGKWSFIAGRKGAMAIATILSGVFLFLFTEATTNQAVLGWNCASALTQNAMYGILYAYTPEVFPTSSRGSGNAICASLNRMFGIIAPLLQSYASSSPATPVFISASLFIVSGVLMLALPIDTAGVDAL